MFNDKYGLTAAVLRGKKTQTRRDATRLVEAYWNGRKLGDYPTLSLGGYVRQHAAYKVGDVVAVEQARRRHQRQQQPLTVKSIIVQFLNYYQIMLRNIPT